MKEILKIFQLSPENVEYLKSKAFGELEVHFCIQFCFCPWTD